MKNYDDILKQLGEFGAFQKRVCGLMFLLVFLTAWMTLSGVIFLYQPAHRCAVPGLEEDSFALQGSWHAQLVNRSVAREGAAFSSCLLLPQAGRSYDTDPGNFSLGGKGPSSGNFSLGGKGPSSGNFSLGVTGPSSGNFSLGVTGPSSGNETGQACSRWVYDTSMITSTIASDLNLVCERSVLRSHVNFLRSLGLFFSSLFMGSVSDRFGRKRTLLVLMITVWLLAMAQAFVHSVTVLMVLKFLEAVSDFGTFQNAFIICMEIVGPSRRVLVGGVIDIFWVTGQFYLIGVAAALRHWRHVTFALSAPFVFCLSYWWVLPESPRWLLAKGRVQEAKAVLEWMARINKVPLEEGWLDSLCTTPPSDSSPAHCETNPAHFETTPAHSNTNPAQCGTNSAQCETNPAHREICLSQSDEKFTLCVDTCTTCDTGAAPCDRSHTHCNSNTTMGNTNPATSNSSPSPSNSSPSPSNSNLAPSYVAPATCDASSAPCDTKPALCDRSPAPCDTKSALCDTSPAPCDASSAPCDTKPALCDTSSAPCDEDAVESDAASSCSPRFFLRQSRLILRGLIVLLCWFTVALTYYGISLNVSNLSGDLYVNFASMELVELAGYALGLLALLRLGRRAVNSATLILTGAVCLAVIVPTSLRSPASAHVVLGLSLAGKMAVSAAFCVLYVYTAELLPTSHRALGSGLASGAGRLGSTLSPYIADIRFFVPGAIGRTAPLLVFGGLGVATGVIALGLPETFNTRLPDTVEELPGYKRPRQKSFSKEARIV